MPPEPIIHLKRDSIVTIHDQLVAHFSERISSGALMPGTLLPSENRLSADLKISRTTVRRAFETLGYAGLVATRHGKGTYVAPRISQESGLIGYIGQSLIEGTSSELFSHLSEALEAHKSRGWNLLMCSAENNLERQLGYVETMMDHGVQGIIFTPAVLEDPLRNQSTILALESSGVPFVLIDREVVGAEVDSIVADHEKAGYIGTEHLIGLGHKRIAFVNNPPSPSIAEIDRGYRAALQQHGLTHDPDLTFRRTDLANRLGTVLSQGATALLGHSDFAARDALSWCSENGIRVPEQMAIVGIGNLRHAVGPEPVMSTVRKDFKQMANLALDILVQRMDNEAGGSGRRHEVVDVDLVVRTTCGAVGVTREDYDETR
jgi:DNA-binding LacI/PurR family transcriptional regulator